ncbi:MAG: hypothetical protein NZZ60_01255 [Bacteroidia bacterium]|nr:hypothetical protein [Bacteroidia bacterium]MCX7652723.1 hypothetical protein [Bacteroidia bacterium]MDW8416393.1 hypothetical protein [Bacteroidia bacterium]
MRIVSGVIIGAALIGILFLPAGTPALEASYTLTADRLSQGYKLYAELQVPLDVGFTYLYKALNEGGTFALRIWKLFGGIALLLFLIQSRSRLLDTPYTFLLQAIAVALYLLYPWQNSFSVGEPLLWMLILLNYQASYPFERGALTGLGIILFPAGALAGVWTMYRRLEEKNLRALLIWGLGVAWSILGGVAFLRLQGQLHAYALDFWLSSWQDTGPPKKWEWLLRGTAVFLLILIGQAYFRSPYAERRLFRDRLWAGIVAVPSPAAIPLWTALLAELRTHDLPRYIGVTLCMTQIIQWTDAVRHRSLCQMTLPSQSCLWGEPPCYIRLISPYSCDWSVPFRWKKHLQKPQWEMFYEKWGTPKYILDASGLWAEALYYLPHLSSQYVLRDTTGSSNLRLYQRR